MANQILKKFIAPNAVDGAKIRLLNAQALRARNAADSADIDVLKLDASDHLVLNAAQIDMSNAIVTDIAQLKATAVKVGASEIALSDSAGALAIAANVDMGSSYKITNLVAGSSTNDAVTYGQLIAVSNGNIWQAPINDPDLVDDSLSAPPGSPVVGYVYIVAASASGAWAGLEGHAMFYNGTSWVDLLGRAVQAGDRFGVGIYASSGDLGGGLVGHSKALAQIVTATPGSISYTFHAPATYDTVYVSNETSTHFAHTYNYNGSMWVEIAGPGALLAGDALAYSGNTLNVLYDNSTIDLTMANKLQLKSGGITNSHINASAAIAFSKMAALTASKALVSDSFGVVSASAMDASYLDATSSIQNQLDAKANRYLSNLQSPTAINQDMLPGSVGLKLGDAMAGAVWASGAIATLTTLNVQSGPFPFNLTGLNLGVAGILHSDSSGNLSSSAIVNADVSASAAIAYSKLALSNSIVNADVSSSAAIAYSKLALSNSIVNNDISSSAAIAYSKLALSNSIVNADIASAAAIAYSKLNLAASIVNADISSSAAIAYSKLDLAGSVKLGSDVTGVLPIANGGTNSSTALNNGRMMASVSGAIVESDFYYDSTNKRLGMGSASPSDYLDIVNADSNPSGISLTNNNSNAFTNGAVKMFKSKNNGAVDAFTILGAMAFTGKDDVGYGMPAALINAISLENFSSSAHGAAVAISAADIGSTTVNPAVLVSAGKMAVCAPDGTPGKAVGLKVSNSATGHDYVLPLAQGAAGEVLHNDGSGNLSWGYIDLTDANEVSGVLPTSAGGTGLNFIGSPYQILRVNADGDALEYASDAAVWNKESITLSSGDISNQYVDLAYTADENSIVAFVGRLGLHKTEDYTVTIESGKTRITFANSIATGGDEALVAGDKLFFTYARNG